MPINRIESLPEVKLEDDCRGTSLVAALDNFSSINKVLSNTTTFDEPGLIRVFMIITQYNLDHHNIRTLTLTNTRI